MGTIVNNLSNFYPDFYNGEEFTKEKAERFFSKCDDMERRANYIRQIYETILNSSTINETSKVLIKTRKSYAEIARFYNSLHEQEIKDTEDPNSKSIKSDKPYRSKTAALVKADISYTNRKLKSILGNNIVDAEGMQKDFFSLIIYQPEIDNTLWSRSDEALERLKVTLNGKLISKETFWLNIPIREYSKELTDREFNYLLEIIKPYFNSQKAIAQIKLNNMKKEAGYLNYILKANMDTLSEVDSARRDIILSLADKDQVQRFKESDMQSQQDQSCMLEDSSLYQYQSTLLKLREEAEQEKQERIKIMSKVGQIYYQTNGNLSEKHQFAVVTLAKQYEQLKQADIDRQDKISQLETEIQLLKEQEEEKFKMSRYI